MRRHIAAVLVGLTTAVSAMTLSQGASAQAQPALHVIEVSGLMTTPVVAALHDAFAASADDAAGILVIIDSPGSVRIGASVVTPMLSRSTPVAVLVPAGGQATSGAGWVAAVADVLLMAPDGTVGPLLPADLADGEAGSRDPQTSGLREYNQLRRLLKLDDRRARTVAAELSSDRHDSVSMATLGLFDGNASTRDEAIAVLAGLPGSPFRITSQTPLIVHEPEQADRLLRAAATPLGGYVALIGVLGALALFAFSRSWGSVALGLAAPLGVYALTVLPARSWAVALLVFALVALLWDIGFVWLGVPTGLAIVALTAGSIALFHGPSELNVPSPLIGVAAGLAVAGSAAGRERQDRRIASEAI